MNEERFFLSNIGCLVPNYGYHLVPNSLNSLPDPVHLFLQAARYQNPAKSGDTQIGGGNAFTPNSHREDM